ncbi:hypothetical protein QUF80_16090 [Desulfococcaceae bacterium HSG8]|nr:hypothetical protein [Desulfococcaceae bacterium HSG8]
MPHYQAALTLNLMAVRQSLGTSKNNIPGSGKQALPCSVRIDKSEPARRGICQSPASNWRVNVLLQAARQSLAECIPRQSLGTSKKYTRFG